MSNEKIKQSSIYLEEDLKKALKMAVIHNSGQDWKNVSDFIREACWEKLERHGFTPNALSEIFDKKAKIKEYLKSREDK